MLRIVCAGYYDADAVRHYCGKVLGTKLSPHTGDTHTYCDECFLKAMAALDQIHQQKLAIRGLCPRCARAGFQVSVNPKCPAPLCRFCIRQLRDFAVRDQCDAEMIDLRRQFYQDREG